MTRGTRPGHSRSRRAGAPGRPADGVVPEGYDAEDLTCYTTVRTGIAEALSPCFRRRTEPVGDGNRFVKEVYASTKTVRLNGIDVRPNSGVAIEIDGWTAQVRTIGGKAKASVDAGSTLGKLTFYYGAIDWDLPAGKSARFNLGSISITKGAELFGLSVEGDARLDLVYRGAEIPVTIHLPSPLDVSATVTLKTDNLKGLRLEEVHLRVKNASFGAFKVNDLDLRYNAAAFQFDGFADLSLTSVGILKVSIQVIGSTITMFAADFTPVPRWRSGRACSSQHIDFAYDAGPPLTLNGGVKLTAGPPVNGVAAAAIEGRLKFVASDPWLLRADGTASIAGFGVASAYLQYQSNGMIRLGGAIDAAALRHRQRQGQHRHVALRPDHEVQRPGPWRGLRLEGLRRRRPGHLQHRRGRLRLHQVGELRAGLPLGRRVQVLPLGLRHQPLGLDLGRRPAQPAGVVRRVAAPSPPRT